MAASKKGGNARGYRSVNAGPGAGWLVGPVAPKKHFQDLADHDEQENGSSAPATMPDAVSSAPTSSAPPGITVTPNLGAEPTARRSGRKRKEREELKDLSAALSACICGSSAAPLDSSEHPNVVSGEGKRP
ncbi:hypothetical protein B0H10DRAFT_1958144 [Mycena sp. CBHHK59/15]|nr:hypothetical protein B0H10DRAFT_1958144 [Mycena sp. CBHHK59/15]